MIDCIYIAASALDGRYTRICVASVRHFYPDIRIRILAGSPLQRGLADELKKYWSVGVADIPKGVYGWGFVKLEPLFGPPGERFLVLDSDTVITGPVLQLAEQPNTDFVVDDEEQSSERAKEIYYDCPGAAKEGYSLQGPAFLFNSGQWFGRSGVLSREDFSGLVEWDFPRRLGYPRIFKNGEQGVFNFVVNQQWRAGKIRVARVPLMCWPGHGMQGLDAESVSKRVAVPLVVHWAGMKRPRQRDMVGADLLAHFEAAYHQLLPAGRVRKFVAGYQYAWSDRLQYVRKMMRLALGKQAGSHLTKSSEKTSLRSL